MDVTLSFIHFDSGKEQSQWWIEALSHWNHSNGISAANMNRRTVNETIIIIMVFGMVWMHSSLIGSKGPWIIWNVEMKSFDQFYAMKFLKLKLFWFIVVAKHFIYPIYSIWMSIDCVHRIEYISNIFNFQHDSFELTISVFFFLEY